MKLPYTLELNRRLDRWVRVNADGTITVRPGKVEIGQGIVSAMAHIAAEELDVDYSRIRMVAVDTTFSPDERSTSGSRSIANAVFDALGVRVRDLPITRERIVAALAS